MFFAEYKGYFSFKYKQNPGNERKKVQNQGK